MLEQYYLASKILVERLLESDDETGFQAVDIEALSTLSSRAKIARDDLSLKLDQWVVDAYEQTTTIVFATSENVQRQARATLLLDLLLLAGLLIVLVGSVRNIVAPINTLVRWTREVAKGSFDRSMPIGKFGRDEIGDLGAAFEEMTSGLSKTTVSMDRLDKILDSMTESLLVLSADAQIERVNRAGVKLFGHQEQDLLGRTLDALFQGETEFQWNLAAVGCSHPAITKRTEKVIACRDGSSIPVLFSGAIMEDNQGTVLGAVCVIQDLRQQKEQEENRLKLERQLIQAQKLESIGQLAAGIAHEINTPLSTWVITPISSKMRSTTSAFYSIRLQSYRHLPAVPCRRKCLVRRWRRPMLPF
jgi:PAS domain S-box-containing protein